jgi:hypothetical protein
VIAGGARAIAGVRVVLCAECQATVVYADNGIYLDQPAVPWDGGRASWTLLPMGGSSTDVWATNGDADVHGLAHTLHEHQPPDSPFA